MKPLDKDLTHDVTRWTRNMFRDNASERTTALAETVAARAADPAWSTFTREVFGRMYGIGCKPKSEVATAHEWASKAHALCDELPEWRAMKSSAYADDVMAGIASAAVCNVIEQRLPKGALCDPDGEQETLQQLREMQGEASTASETKKIGAAVRRQEKLINTLAARAEAASDAMDAKGADIRSALRVALAEAKATSDQLGEGLVGLGAGDGTSAVERRALANRIALSASLKRMLALAGRMRISARKRQASKKSNSPQEIVSVETGGDLSRLVPSELAMIAGERTRTLAFARMLERNAVQYSLEGKDPQERGPIVVCVDESGSMEGERNECAKAVMLAMIEIAIKQKRALGVVHFSSSCVPFVLYEPHLGAPSPSVLMDHAEMFLNRGTNIEAAITSGIQLMQGKSLRRASLVLLTDAETQGDMDAALRMVALHEIDYHVVDFAPGAGMGVEKQALKAGAETWTDFDAREKTPDTKRFENLFSM